MAGRTSDRLQTLGLLAAVVSLPLVGARISGRPLDGLLAFPPPSRIPTQYPTWSWIAFALVSGLLVAVAWWWRAAVRQRVPSPAPTDRGKRRFPWWGWVAFAWTCVWWILAWTRFAWFSPLQRLTFFPLWIGLIGTLCALTWTRTGRPSLLAQPTRALPVFAVSAVFWWVFEWLNRFVGNWHYLGVEDFGSTAYALHASICFSTVLPAVFAVREWLGTFPTFATVSAHAPTGPWRTAPRTGASLIIAGGGCLILTGARPQEFYAAVWLAPLLLACGVGLVRGQRGFWSELAENDGRSVAAWALAALICGFCWEMWNVFSAAKWIYTVPYVERWHLFEMPVLGYAGYLGFGIECRLVVERLGAFSSGESLAAAG